MNSFDTLLEIMSVPADQLGEYDLRANLLGIIQVENKWGRIEETRSQQGKTWLTLKYLLANPGREIDAEELTEALFSDEAKKESEIAMRTRLSRTRKLLEPLHLNGTRNGLILFSVGKYSLNPQYNLYTDEELFVELNRRTMALPVTDPAGLELCIKALELFRGPYMDHSLTVPWLDTYRQICREEYVDLAQDTLSRVVALNDSRALSLLCRRAPMIAPEAEDLHKAIISYLTDHKQNLELIRYISQLTHSGAKWLDTLEN